MESSGEEDQLLSCLCRILLWVKDVVTVSECGDKLLDSALSSKLVFLSSFSVRFTTAAQ